VSDRPPQDPLLGALLGSCLIERPLGAGGMSAVYLARQERPRRYVALKAVRPSLTPDRKYWPLFLARFRREADAMAALDHANITPIYEFGEQDDLAYLVMPYLSDGSLADLLAREGPLPVEQVVAYVDQVAAALDYAHQHGIIHRDVKPSNVLLHPDGRLLLSDFGIARPLDQRDLPGAGPSGVGGDGALTMAGAALGTPDFMAPEQVLGQPVGAAADVYALGSLAYTLLAGHTPFGGSDTQQTLARQLREPPQPLRLDRPDIPARVEEAIFWALAKDPAERPASAGALAQALRGGLRSGPLAMGAALWRRAATTGSSLSSYVGSGALGPAGRPPTPPVVEPMGPSSPNAVTVWDARFDAGGPSRVAPSAARAWPGPGSKQAGITISPLMMAAIGLALVALLAMAATVGGLIGSSNPLGAIGGLGATATATSLPTVTPSPSPSPSPTPPPNWLSADTTAITLGCNGSKRTQYIRLTNLGTSKLEWYENTQAAFGIEGISVKPDSGDLGPNHTVVIAVTNTQTFFSHSGELDFIPSGDNADNAGNSWVVTYSTSCGGGGGG
jgi:serine/threonine protein kinase